MKKALGAIVTAVTMMCVPVPAFAQSPWVEGATYLERISGKFFFGLQNTLFGWTELITEPLETDNIAIGAVTGAFHALGDTLGGAVHLATFPLPQIDVPLPEEGVFSDF